MSIQPPSLETITACENVCRDFAWLSRWAPALIASATALLIAFVAYPYQKRRDRELQIQLETRSAVRTVADKANRWFIAILRKETGGTAVHTQEFLEAAADCLLFVDKKLARLLLKYFESLSDFDHFVMEEFDSEVGEEDEFEYEVEYEKRRKAVSFSRQEFLIQARSELVGEELEAARTAISAFFQSPQEDGK